MVGTFDTYGRKGAKGKSAFAFVILLNKDHALISRRISQNRVKRVRRIMDALSTNFPPGTEDIYNNISKLCKLWVKSYLEMNLSIFIFFSFDRLQGAKIGFYIPLINR
jgi:hypothetical protein